MKKSVALVGLFGFVLGCQPESGRGSAVPDVTASKLISVKNVSASPNKAEVNDSSLTVKALLWNEQAGYRISRHGFLNHDTEFYHQDRYDGAEEKLQQFFPIPRLVFRVGEDELTPTEGLTYSQTMDFRTGILSTSWKQEAQGNVVNVEVASYVDPRGSLISELKLSSFTNCELTLTIRNADPSRRLTAKSVRTTVDVEFPFAHRDLPTPVGMNTIWRKKVQTREPVMIRLTYKGGNQISNEVSHSASLIIDGPLEDQQFVNSAVYYLTALMGKGSKMGVSPLGLSGTTYNGHVFWDADVWVFPTLALIDPDGAKAISDYRIRQAQSAKKNFKSRASFATGARELGPELDDVDGLQFPWESSVSGREVCPTEARQQHHITASVMHGLSLANDLGLADSETVKDIGRLAANFFEFRSWPIEGEGLGRAKLTIQHTMSPDEFHTGDDDLYTNIAVEQVMKRYGKGMQNIEFFRPRDEKSFLNYSDDRLRGYKQAAGVLAIFPLQDPAVEKEARIMLERFADKVTENGPAMSDSVHALIWARLGETEKAYEKWHKSWQPFTQHPLLLFSEKKRKEVTYFTTGAAGSLQTVLYGFLGFRLDYEKQPGAAWSTPLRNGRWLSVKPNLPKEWKKVTLRNFTVLGKRYTLTATHTGVDVSLEKN